MRDDILRELTYTGRIFSAQEALSYGALQRASATIRAQPRSRSRREIAGKSPDAIRAAKRMLNNLSVDPGPALLAESVEQMKLTGQHQPDSKRSAPISKNARRALRTFEPTLTVMAELVPAIHVLAHELQDKTWITGTSPVMTG